MNYDFKLVESKVEAFWKKKQAKIKKSLQYEPKKKMFSFLEGPPTANASPGLHHMEARVFKDIVCRFNFMKGFAVPRKGGWDCHGLPVEVQIEKQLKLGTKKDVLKYGIGNFNQACRKSVFSHIEEWNKFTEKLAYWIDLKNPYITLENNYIESVWWSLKEIYKKGLLYEGYKVVPFCPRCETTLSSHEVAQGYEEIEEETITVKFKEKGKERYFLSWTTTPWTLPSNIALAVNQNLTYVVVKHEGKEYVITENRAYHYFKNPEIVKKIKGKELKGTEYEPLFDYFVGKVNKPAWKIIPADYVADTEGTGIVHTAPAFGEVDYENCKEYGMAFVNPVTINGVFKEEVKDFAGLSIFAANKKIIEKLKAEGKLFSTERYKHDYPFCWRCKNPLMYYATNSWFIAMSKFRSQLVKNNEKINWFPDYIKEGRFGNWLAEIKDWALSRQKFWGTPLNIWKCECGNRECIGSVEELRKKAVNAKGKIDLHKPEIDEIKLKCKCGKEMKRVPDVIDCWYDSGCAPFAQFHYPFENKEMFKKSFPYDFIAEALDQTRGWFYTMHAISTILFNTPAYKNVICAGLVVDDKGEKMSKSKGNIIDPWQMFSLIGVDASRLLMCLSAPGNDKRIGTETANKTVMPFITILWNSYLFAKDMKRTGVKKLKLEDKWLISKVNSLNESVEKNLEANEFQLCHSDIKDFVMNDLSRFYIKLVKKRDDASVKFTLNYVFDRLAKLMAPFMPYFSEFLYLDLLGKKNSVHFEKWPSVERKHLNKKLEREVEIIKNIVETSHAERKNVNIKLKYPLRLATVDCEKETADAIKHQKDILCRMANIKDVKIGKKSKEIKIELDTKIDGKLKQEWLLRELLRAVQEKRKEMGLNIKDKISLYLPDEKAFKAEKKTIEQTTGSKVTFGKIRGKREEFEFEGKKYEFGVEK